MTKKKEIAKLVQVLRDSISVFPSVISKQLWLLCINDALETLFALFLYFLAMDA